MWETWVGLDGTDEANRRMAEGWEPFAMALIPIQSGIAVTRDNPFNAFQKVVSLKKYHGPESAKNGTPAP